MLMLAVNQLLAIANNPPTFDGDLICKNSAKMLAKNDYITRCRGFCILTKKGLETLIDLELVKA